MNGIDRVGIEVAKSLAVGFTIDQVRSRGRMVMTLGGLVLLAGIVLTFVLDGGPRILAVIAALAGAVVLVGAWALRGVTVRLLSRFADPALAADSAGEVDAALDDLDLPTGALSAARFAWRLRKGAGPEVARITNVVEQLAAQIKPDSA